MQRIVPHLWYDKEASDAAKFYVSLFDNSSLLSETILEDTPSGNAEVVTFELAGQEFQAISAGPYFKFNPSISLMVACESIEEVNSKWEVLSKGGQELMPLGEYPFCKWYGWIQDKYGLSWQLMLKENEKTTQKITPCFLFSKESCGKAEEAMRYYTEIFENSEIETISRYKEGEAKSSKAKINYAAFKLEDINFCAMDHGFDADFTFNEAFSIIINCENQQEIDYFWSKLSAIPEAEECGWVKDKFGVSWQVVPTIMKEMMKSADREKIKRVTEAFLKMKKFDLEILKAAYEGE
jgi:predicted 3-demethylubiquinone-9 3-methyltransferase (glyoxalase superfamily)